MTDFVHSGSRIPVVALVILGCLVPDVWAGNAGPTITEALSEAEEEREISIEPLFSPRVEAEAAKTYDDFRDMIVEETGFDYLLMYSLFWQHGSQDSPENGAFTGQFDTLVRWTLFDSPAFGVGAIKFHYMNLHNISHTTNAKFANALGSIWTTTDSDAANTVRAAYWQQQLFDEKLEIDIGWIDAWRAFNDSTYAGDDRSAFAALPVSSNPVRHVVFGALGATIELEPADFLTLKAGFNDANFNSFPNGEGFSRGEFQIQGEATFNTKAFGLEEGHWRFYGYHVDRTANNPAGEGFAVSIDQDVSEEWATFLRYGIAFGARRDLAQTLSSGVVFKQPFNFARDRLGVAFMWGRPTNRQLRDQYGLESYWRVQLTDRVEFGPDLQLLINPSKAPMNDVEIVGGLRARLLL